MSDQKQQTELSIMTDEKLHLKLPPLKDGNRPVTLKFKFKDNNVHMVVDYGEKTEKGYPISTESALSPVVFNGYLELLTLAIAAKQQVAWEVTNWGHPYIWNKDQGKSIRSEERMITSKVSIGRHENGEIFISVAAKGKQTVEFQFKADEYHPYSQSGGDLSTAMESTIAARTWLNLMRDVHNYTFISKWKEPEWKRKKRMEYLATLPQRGGQRPGGGSGGGNNNYNRNNSGGGQQQSRPQPQQQMTMDDFDEHLPF